MAPVSPQFSPMRSQFSVPPRSVSPVSPIDGGSVGFPSRAASTITRGSSFGGGGSGGSSGGRSVIPRKPVPQQSRID